MRVAVNLPQWGMGQNEGAVIEWQVHASDHVVEGQIIALVETSKVEGEIVATQTGTIVELCVAEGETVPVGAVLAIIETE